MALADRAELAVRLTLDDRAFTGPLRGVQRSLSGLNKGFGQVSRGVGQLGVGFARVGYVAAAAAAGGLIAAAKAGADFEAQLRTINTIAREDAAGLTIIGDGIRQLAREGRGDLADLSQGYYDILSAGIAAADAQGVLTSATTLAIGGLSTNAQAVDLLTTAINAYGQEASQAQADADLFAKSIELGKVTADEIAASFANVAPIAAQQKIEIEEVAAAYAALTAQGVPAAEVTTQMQRAIVELLSPNADLIALQKELGVSFLKVAQEDGLVVALQAMRDAVDGDEEAFKALFGRVEGYKFALQTTGPQQQIYNDALVAMGDAAGTAAEQMAERQQGLAYAVNRLKANLVDAGITLATGFLPALTRAADKLSQFLGSAENRDQLTQLGKDIGSLIDGIDFNKVLAGAKVLIAIIKDIWFWLSKIPVEIHAAVLAFAALNRASGGLIGAGAGNIIAGVGSGVLSKLPGKAAGIGKLFAQPVFVTNWPLGFGGGVGGAGKPGIFGRAAGGLGAALGGGTALGAAGILASGAALVAGLVAVQKGIIEPKLQEQAGANVANTQAIIARSEINEVTAALQGLRNDTASLSGIQRILYDLNANGVKTHTESLEAALVGKLNALRAAVVTTAQAKTAREDTPADQILKEIARNTRDTPDKTARRQAGGFARLRERLEAAKATVAAGTQKITALQAATRAGVAAAKVAQIAAGHADKNAIVSAIYRNRPIVNVSVVGLVQTVVKAGTTVNAGGKYGNKQVPAP